MERREQAAGAIPGIYLAGLAAVTLLGSALRVRAVFYPLHHDEAYTFLTYGLQPLWATLSSYNSPNNHLLHSALVRISYLLLGDHEWAVRMPALAAGILIIPATFAFFARLADRGSALLAAALVACSPEMIAYAANARGYSQATLLGLLMLLAAACLRSPQPAASPLPATWSVQHRWRLWVMLVMASVAALYTIPTMAYAAAMVWTWMAIAPGQGGRLQYSSIVMSGIVVVVITALLYLPPVMNSGWRALFRNPFVAPLGWANFVSALPGSLAATWFDWRRNLPAAVAWASLLGFGSCIIGGIISRRLRPLLELALAALVGIGVVIFCQRVAPPSRVWLFLLPVYCGMAAAGLGSMLALAGRVMDPGRIRPPSPLWGRAAAVAMVLVLAASIGLPLVNDDALLADNEARNLPAIADVLAGKLHPGDSVLAAPPLREPLAYYFYRRNLSQAYLDTPPQEHGRCFLIRDTRYLPGRGSAVGRIVFDESMAARLLLVASVGTSAVYELQAEPPSDRLTRSATSVEREPRRRRE